MEQLRRNSTSNVCMTKECVTTAAQIMSGMDFTAQPCEDFYQYACGMWNKKYVIPEDKATFGTFEKLYDELLIIMRALLEDHKRPEDSDATMKAKLFYRSCINFTISAVDGRKIVDDLINELGGWPILDDRWSSEGFNLARTLAKVRLMDTGSMAAFLLSAVGADDKNSSVNIIQLDQGNFGMPSKEYYLLPNHSEHKLAYSRFMKKVIEFLGGKGPDLTQKVEAILEFETKLANASRPNEERHDTGALYDKKTIRDFQKLMPGFDLMTYLTHLIPDPITEEEPLVVFATTYFQDALKVVQETDVRTVANYLVWRVIMNLAPEFSEPILKASNDYKLVIQGVKKDQVRWKKCVESANEKLGMIVGAMFIRDNFKKESKDTALEMIHNIREAFNDLLEENDWMDEKTKEFAKEKANAMKERIGYPDILTDSKQLDSKYESLKLTEDYVHNVKHIIEFSARKLMSKLREPVNKTNWEQDPVVVNAFYSPNANDILFPAGILQPSFYSATFPKSLNYGGIGVVIGHEITHGFDDKGRQYDKNGNIKQWWDNRTIDAFRQRAQCFIDQYSNFKLEQINEYMSGKISQGENIADNGGLKQSYRAYRKWVEKNGEEPALPGIGLSHNQLFFLNFAQIWCGLMRDEEALRKIRTSAHSLGPIRVFGPLSNSKEFSQAYGCPLGSKMNPVHKCSLW
ncbi:neprilysin-1-like isoform X2 [Physella acuta]|nr:neprilysin-1-like isoform X2 [Physella acuta]